MYFEGVCFIHCYFRSDRVVLFFWLDKNMLKTLSHFSFLFPLLVFLKTIPTVLLVLLRTIASHATVVFTELLLMSYSRVPTLAWRNGLGFLYASFRLWYKHCYICVKGLYQLVVSIRNLIQSCHPPPPHSPSLSPDTSTYGEG